MRQTHLGLDFRGLRSWCDLAETSFGTNYTFGILRHGPAGLRPLTRGTQFVHFAHLILRLNGFARLWGLFAPRTGVAVRALRIRRA